MCSKLWFILLIIYEIFACLPDGRSSTVTIGAKTFVCVTLAPLNWGNNGSVFRVSSQLTADTFSSVNVKKSWTSRSYYNDTLLNRLNITEDLGHGLAVGVESMGAVSYQKAYRTVRVVSESNSSRTETVTSPLLLAIINVEGGTVTSIDWDDGCRWCSGEHCWANELNYLGRVAGPTSACWLRDTDCSVLGHNTTTNALCELNVYVVWSGTDSKGMYFGSSAARFSRFTHTQITQFTNSKRAEQT